MGKINLILYLTLWMTSGTYPYSYRRFNMFTLLTSNKALQTLKVFVVSHVISFTGEAVA